jgi:hypothetical protein
VGRLGVHGGTGAPARRVSTHIRSIHAKKNSPSISASRSIGAMKRLSVRAPPKVIAFHQR